MSREGESGLGLLAIALITIIVVIVAQLARVVFSIVVLLWIQGF